MSPFRKALVATLVVAIIFAVAGSKPASASTVTPSSGDGWFALCRKCGLSATNSCVASISALNGGGSPKLGKSYSCPSGSSSQAEVGVASAMYSATASVAVNPGGTYYVQKGDTLSSIASRFGTTVGELQRINGITNPDRIAIGQAVSLSVSVGTAVASVSDQGTSDAGSPVETVRSVDWNVATSKVQNRVFETKQAAAEWLASVYNGASSAYRSFLETNGVNILIGTSSLGGAIWLVKAAAGLSQGPLLTAAVVAFGVMVIFAIVEYVIAYIRR